MSVDPVGSGMARKRVWLAVVLAVCYPGLGHVYLREWLRSLLWLLLAVAAAVLFVDGSAIDESASVLANVEAIYAAMSPLELGSLSAVLVFSIVDAYRLARERQRVAARRDGTEAAACPHCGKPLDDDLTFCHWCTTRLEGE